MRISIENSPSPPPAPRRERSQRQILNSAHGLGRGKQMGQSVGQKFPNAKNSFAAVIHTKSFDLQDNFDFERVRQ